MSNNIKDIENRLRLMTESVKRQLEKKDPDFLAKLIPEATAMLEALKKHKYSKTKQSKLVMRRDTKEKK